MAQGARIGERRAGRGAPDGRAGDLAGRPPAPGALRAAAAPRRLGESAGVAVASGLSVRESPTALRRSAKSPTRGEVTDRPPVPGAIGAAEVSRMDGDAAEAASGLDVREPPASRRRSKSENPPRGEGPGASAPPGPDRSVGRAVRGGDPSAGVEPSSPAGAREASRAEFREVDGVLRLFFMLPTLTTPLRTTRNTMSNRGSPKSPSFWPKPFCCAEAADFLKSATPALRAPANGQFLAGVFPEVAAC